MIQPDEAGVLARLSARWMATPAIRLAVMTSSRARRDRARDALSDYDIVLGLTDLTIVTDDWLAEFGAPLITLRDPGDGLGASCMTLFADGVKLDLTLVDIDDLSALAARGALPDELNRGYRVLFDPDGIAAGWPVASGTGYLPAPPTAAEFAYLVDEVWFCATYVAKYLWRGEFLPARVIFDQEIKYTLIVKLLTWRAGIDHGWQQGPGFFGRGLGALLPPAVWDAYQATYTGPDPEASWTALWNLLDLFTGIARGVAADHGFSYPDALEASMRAYLDDIARLPPPAA